MRIVVLDSGLDPGCLLAKKQNFSGGLEFFLDDKENVMMLRNSVDDMGHGTAVASIINHTAPFAEIIPIKIVKNGAESNLDVLIYALRYILENIECRLIHLSAGIVCCEDISELYQICYELKINNKFIIAACDNEGVVSYPASFDCVISFDGGTYSREIQKYYYFKNEVSNFYGNIVEQRVPWLNNEKQVVSGNSFLAPYFTGIIANRLKEEEMNFDELCDYLKDNAVNELVRNEFFPNKLSLDIKDAVIFPFNKEMHSLARFEKLLNFNIYGFYDVKYSGQVGKSIEELQGISGNYDIVKNIDGLDWNEKFDTVILGHTNNLTRAVGTNYEDVIIDKCIKHNKKLFACKDIRYNDKVLKSNLLFYSPTVEWGKVNVHSKMHVIGCPVVSVVGTGSKQGKFTLQLGLREELLNRGYKLGQLGTEPTAELFGMDYTYPMGYESAVYVKGFEAVYCVNRMMGLIEKNNPDLIICGSQAHSVPYQVGGLAEYPVRQHEFLLGVQSDAYILCVDDQASNSYIYRTISYLENLFQSKVICIIISNLSIKYRWSTINSKMTLLEKNELEDIKKRINKEIKIPVLIMGDDSLYKDIADLIEKNFI